MSEYKPNPDDYDETGRMKTLHEQGFYLRGALPQIVLLGIIVGAMISIFMPEGGIFSGIRVIAGMVQMVCLGIIVAAQFPIWERSKPPKSKKANESEAEKSE